MKRNDRIPTRQQVQAYLTLLPEQIVEEPEFAVLMSLLNPANLLGPGGDDRQFSQQYL